jgi:hypothetical protein
MAVASGWVRSPRGSASGSLSLDVESDRESLVVASLGACRFEPGREAGGSAAPEELDPELESDRESAAGAGTVEVRVGSFVVLEVSVLESVAASEGAAPEASAGVAEGSVGVAPSVVSVAAAAGAHVSVVSAAAAEVSVVVAEVSVESDSEAHVLVVSAAAAESNVVVAACLLRQHRAHVSSCLPWQRVVCRGQASTGSGAVAHAPVVSATAERPSS